jgi:hypothetical protein
MDSLDEKRKTIANDKDKIKVARVIANYGDPGLDEDSHFDILSRYVIAMLESCDRVLTHDRWIKMLIVVKRPDNLWIQRAGDSNANLTSIQRVDSQGNVNVGSASNYSVKGISRINKPYTLGESIRVRKSLTPSTTTTEPTFFQAGFDNTFWTSDYKFYNPWHSDGSTLPYFANQPNRISYLRNKTITPVSSDTTHSQYLFTLHKLQYEAAILTMYPSLVNSLTTIFNGSWVGASQVYSAHGGYLFQSQDYDNCSQIIASCEYEDINVGQKQRVPSAECIPLIVTTPNSFPTPKVRSVGTINYNPSYSTISR